MKSVKNFFVDNQRTLQREAWVEINGTPSKIGETPAAIFMTSFRNGSDAPWGWYNGEAPDAEA